VDIGRPLSVIDRAWQQRRRQSRSFVSAERIVPLTFPASEFQLTRSPTLKALVMTTRFNAWQWELPQRLEFSEL
jgi:hypothetical protein